MWAVKTNVQSNLTHNVECLVQEKNQKRVYYFTIYCFSSIFNPYILQLAKDVCCKYSREKYEAS